MCNNPEVSGLLSSSPGATYTGSDPYEGQALNKRLTGEKRLNRYEGQALNPFTTGQERRQAPSAPEKAALLGESASKNVSKATQTARRRKAVAIEPVVPGKTPVIR